MRLTKTQKKVAIAGAGIGLLALTWLALRSKPSSVTATLKDVNRVSARALAIENDPTVLRSYAAALRDAGYAGQAILITSRADYFSGPSSRAKEERGQMVMVR